MANRESKIERFNNPVLSLNFYIIQKRKSDYMEKIINGVIFRHTNIRNYWISQYRDVINMDYPNKRYIGKV